MNCLWNPSKTRSENSALAQFMKRVDVGLDDNGFNYDELWEYSIDNLDAFWSSVWDFCAVIGNKGQVILERHEHLIDCRFFPDARLNYAENLLQRNDAENAIIFVGENGLTRSMSWQQLQQDVARLQVALKNDGIKPGDRIAGIVANTPEAVVAMLATVSIGAIWSSCSPDFGVNGIIDRFGQIQPSILFSMDGYFYAGKWYNTREISAQVFSKIQSLKRNLVISYSGDSAETSESGDNFTAYKDYLESNDNLVPKFEQFDFRAPLFIMFSSGTTGLPKCIVHSNGGTLLQHLKEHQLQCDIQDGDRMLYFTTCGWMMWNWMVSALASNASLVLYDGSPVHPAPDRLAGLIDQYQATQFGASAKYFDGCLKNGVRPMDHFQFNHLRSIFSTGSPLSSESFDYVYANWKQDICLSSIAGGTDIIGCFVGGSPISPVYRGQCQKRLLGMDVQVYDEHGKSVQGKAGELVCASPHPTIPISFFNDPENIRFKDAYFNKYQGVWHHGDWVELTDNGGLIFYGRSDATLNPSGVRIGTAEIYRPVEQLPEVLESVVIARKMDVDVELVLFVKLQDGIVLDDKLIQRIKTTIRKNTSPRHVPAMVIAIKDIPRTKSGKIVELAVRDIVNGKEVKNIHALANPEALEYFKGIPELSV